MKLIITFNCFRVIIIHIGLAFNLKVKSKAKDNKLKTDQDK